MKFKSITRKTFSLMLVLALSISMLWPLNTIAATAEDISVEYNFTGTTGEVLINGKRAGSEGASWSGTVEDAGTTNVDETNEITINTSFGEPMLSKVTINGEEYTFTDEGDQHTVTVPGASSYTILGTANNSIVTPKTIIWVNPDWVAKEPADELWAKEFRIEHGYAKAIAVYDKEGRKLNPDDYINTTVQPDGTKSDQYGLNNGFGWVKILPGYKVVFEFVPEYGYQLTSISINGQPISASSDMNKFEFTMPDASGNIHFAAKFSATSDVVKTNSKKVSGGSIVLANGELANGSAQLTINDIELDSSKIKDFENAANGYKVSNYINIDLYNVFYKGKDDADDVWSNKIDELDGYATVSMKLADGLTADDIVIVHNIHDGEEFEVIKIESYDPKTNIITFKVKSFSNYAIATKESAKAVQTGDNIKTYIAIAIVSVVAVLVATVCLKKRVKNN